MLDRPSVPNGLLSYSAGTTSLDPYGFRLVESGSGRIELAVDLFPELGKLLSSGVILISCYPASLGFFQQIPSIDTYLRGHTFSRGLLLARAEEKLALVLGQPLATVHLVLEHLNNKRQMPKTMLFVMGGYYCPFSLENYLANVLSANGTKCEIIFGYGVAEVEYGCFLGKRIKNSRDIEYFLASDKVEWHIDASSKLLHIKRKYDGRFLVVGDYAEKTQSGLCIRNASDRLAPSVANELETWTNSEWERRTGYVFLKGDEIHKQLREGIEPTMSGEVEFFDFLKRFGGSWTEKPIWGQGTQESYWFYLQRGYLARIQLFG